ncbi:DHS-like NAD/FAD-binding domain-containing protein [Melampsora americana]|nr:DHS-like NAD/FAD-binding domain-containing protein [Melampsora americana]
MGLIQSIRLIVQSFFMNFNKSYLGYPSVRDAEPNIGHYALSALMKMGYVKKIITQNVDRLHHRASLDDESLVNHPSILELHGTLRFVNCLDCGHLIDRNLIQDQLSDLNPDWADHLDHLAIVGQEIKTNPDGDIDLNDRSYDSFVLPKCSKCLNGILKPSVTFFGESLHSQVKSQTEELISNSSNLIIFGSSLTTYSAFKLVKHFKELKPSSKIGLVNIGRCRADEIVDWKIGTDTDEQLGLGCSDVLRAVGSELFERDYSGVGKEREVVRKLLSSGVKKPVP